MYAAETLSDMYWLRARPGDDGRSIEAGFDALRLRARQVLLHADIAHGVVKAGVIADDEHALAHRCVATGRLERAVAAIEGGRGLTMHAAVAGTDIGAMLRELGHESLAHEWERNPGGRTDVPGDLRFRVLKVISGTAAERGVLGAPSPGEIAAALRETGADALVYLIPGNAQHPGRAVLVNAEARIAAVPLPLLDTAEGGEVARYLAVHQQVPAEPGPDQDFALSRWRDELAELVRWAWPAVVDPVLGEIASWRLPRTPHVVLVPCGSLGVVPWHAARDDSTGSQRFALQRTVFSYAASARQLCDVARRPVREPDEDAVVVADPSGQLLGTAREARYLFEHCYPDGMYFGLLPDEIVDDGTGTPEELLAQLPGPRSAGASMLHLACHAATGANPAESYVELADREELTVERLLEHSGNRPADAPGGLVVLAACRSDLTDRDHDEALTLATAFLASGAASVVGTRWAVDDTSSVVLMCLFHRYLTVDRLRPAHALRAAQLWALDPHRVLPPDIAAVLGGIRTDVPLTTWAAYTHQGR
jgi:hypothetical protein